MQTNNAGQIIESVWLTLPERFPSVELDHYVTMPNHFHGIIVRKSQPVSTSEVSNSSKVVDQRVMHSPLPHPVGRDKSGPYDASRHRSEETGLALGEIIRTFKAVSTHSIRTSGNPNFAWQSNYYEHIIRNDNSLDHIRQYIIDNPARWSEDSLHTTKEVS
ncbi:MAG: transposase [Ktedonobacteraceae bacterium]